MTLLADKAATAPRVSWHTRVNPRYVTLAVAAVAVAYLALVPVGTMLYASLQSDFLGTTPSEWTLRNYVNTFTSAGFGTLVLNSFGYAAATATVAVVLGFGLAWLVVRTNTPAKGFARVAALVPLILPGILNTVAWSLLLSPERARSTSRCGPSTCPSSTCSRWPAWSSSRRCTSSRSPT